MPCATVRLDNGYAIVCTGGRPRRRKCHVCGAPAERLCDWPLGCGATCDKPLCAAHALNVGPERDYCPKHARAHAAPDLFEETE